MVILKNYQAKQIMYKTNFVFHIFLFQKKEHIMNYHFEIQWNYETTGDLSMIKPIFGEKMLGKFMLTKCQKHFSKDCAE